MKRLKFSLALVTLIIVCSLALVPVLSGCDNTPEPTTTSPEATTPAETTPAATPAETTPTATPSETTPAATPTETTEVEPIEIKWVMTSTQPNPAFVTYQVYTQFCDEVERLTNNRVEFIELPGAVTAVGSYDGVIAKTGDISGYVAQINTGRFPCTELMTIPDLFSVCQHPSQVMYELYQTTPEIQEEFSEIKILSMFALRPSPPGIGIGSIDTPIQTLEDLDGMKMGVYGEWGTKTMAALGCVPVSYPPVQTYESLQKGLVDAAIIDIEYLDSQNVAEVTEYFINIGFQYSPFWWGMNWDTWNSLPEDIQKVMEEQGALMPGWTDQKVRDAGLATLANHPEITVLDISPEEQVRWLAAQDPVQAEYITVLEEKGIDGQAILDKMNELFVKYAEE